MRISEKIKIMLVCAALLWNVPMQACDNYIPVRVGLSNTSFQTYMFGSISFKNANQLTVMDSSTGYFAPISDSALNVKVTMENNLFRIYIDNELVARNLTGPILVSPKNGSFVEIEGLKRKGKQAAYRGYIELTKSSKGLGKFAVVNVLSLKNYLRGVVPNEMPVRFGLEALKAQTVAARNYAVTPRVKAYQEFDVCDSVACQVYFGANTEASLSDRAIEQTNGVIAIDKEDKPILALYSSTAGGYTESYEFAFSDPKTKAFPSKHIHYLVATPDKKEFDSLESDEAAERFYTSKPEAFDDQSPYYRWSKDWTLQELNTVLSKTLIDQSKTGFVHPAVTDKEQIGTLKSINVLRRGKSGKIIKLAIHTDKDTFVVEKELVIRRCFPKNGISLPSANFVISYIDSEVPVFKFSGGGFGHGVGLSQWGAGKMSSLGYSFEQILKHYYKGIKLATIPVEVYANQKNIERSFFIESETAIVHVNNHHHVKHLKITVNGKNINVNLNGHDENIDISKYIRNGENKISYMIQDETDYSKKISVFVVLSEVEDE